MLKMLHALAPSCLSAECQLASCSHVLCNYLGNTVAVPRVWNTSAELHLVDNYVYVRRLLRAQFVQLRPQRVDFVQIFLLTYTEQVREN